MAFCLRCSKYSCGGVDGLISVSISPNSSVRVITDKSCVEGNDDVDYIPGPAMMTVSITAYAFAAGEDKWLGSRCKGSAQASQTNHTKYDYCTDRYYIIPSRNHTAQVQGVLGDKVTLEKRFFPAEGESDVSIANSKLIGSISLTTEESIELGAVLKYTGYPMAVTIPDLSPYTLSLGDSLRSGYIKSVNISVDFPNPATVTYSFEFPLEGTIYYL